MQNTARWSASDVRVEVTFGDGRPVEGGREILHPFADDDDFMVELRDITADWPKAPGVTIGYRVRFSDARGIARYGLIGECRLDGTRIGDNGIVRMDDNPGPTTQIR